MSFVAAVKNAFIKCFDFKTRSSRSEFWYFYIFTTIMGFIGLQIDQIFQLKIMGLSLIISMDCYFGSIIYIFLFSYFLYILSSLCSKASRYKSFWLVVINRSNSIYWANNLIFFFCLKGSKIVMILRNVNISFFDLIQNIVKK